MKRWVSILIMAVSLVSGCSTFDGLSKIDMSSMSVEQLIQIVEDPKAELFVYATEELARRGADAADAAPVLAKALGYPRHDSDSAGLALLSMASKAEPAIPNLITALESHQAMTRAYAAIVLGAIGQPASCAIPKIAPLLWDNDTTVRGAAAVSLDALTNQNLVPYEYKMKPKSHSGVQDDPEGNITNDARTWWKQTGQFINWDQNSKNCGLLDP